MFEKLKFKIKKRKDIIEWNDELFNENNKLNEENDKLLEENLKLKDKLQELESKNFELEEEIHRLENRDDGDYIYLTQLEDQIKSYEKDENKMIQDFHEIRNIINKYH